MQRTPSRKEATHDRIVQVAAAAIRRSGYDGVGVADIMKTAGLTHGGFYAHFASRDAMLAEAVERAGQEAGESIARQVELRRARGESALRALVESYLSNAHLAATDAGCPVAALGSEMRRQSPEVRSASVVRVRALMARVQEALPAGRGKEQSMAIASTLIGALQLGRTLGDNPQGRAILSAARKAVLAQYDGG
jgi:AcrR family transcriptional regulator